MWSRPYNVICTSETFGMWANTHVGVMSIGSMAGVGDVEGYYRARARAEGEIHE